MGLLKRAEAFPQPYSVQSSGLFDGNDGNWSTFYIKIGSPQLEFRALVSTSSYYTRIVSANGCRSNNAVISGCPNLRGEDGTNTGYDESASTTRDQTTVGDYQFDINQLYLPTDATFGSPPDSVNGSYQMNNNGTFDVDQMQFTSGAANVQPLTMNETALGGIVQTSFFLSEIGLGLGSTLIGKDSIPSLLDNLFNTSLIPSKAFAYTAGAFYKKFPGSLTLGGYDRNRLGQSQSGFSLPHTFGNIIPEVTVTDISVQLPNGNTQSITTAGGSTTNFNAVIESTLPFLYFPSAICDTFQQVFGLQYDTTTGLYRVNATQRQANLGSTIKIVMSDTVQSGTTFEIDLPYDAFDLNTSWPIPNYQNSAAYFPIRRSPTDGATHVLGRTFLQEAYLIVDYERQNFTIGQALFPNSNALSLQPIISSKYSTTSSSSGLSGGAIGGIVVGAVIVVAAVLGLIFFFWRRRRRPVEPKEPEDEKVETASRRDTVDTALTGTTEATQRPAIHGRQPSEMSSDSEHVIHVNPGGLYELPEEGKPIELEDQSDTTRWIRNSERLTNQGQGRFHELIGDYPLGAPHSTGSTPRFTTATPVGSPPNAGTPAETTPQTAAALLAANSNRSSFRRNRRRTNSGGVSPASAGVSPHGSTAYAVTPVSEGQTPVLGAVSPRDVTPQASPDPEAQRRLQ